MVVFYHVCPHITQQTQALDRFMQFMIKIMKLRLNASLQNLAYQFAVSVSTISRVFYHLIVEMDSRLFRFVYWQNRDLILWTTKPQCFEYTFEQKSTVIIDCFKVFIETGYRLSQATNTTTPSKL